MDQLSLTFGALADPTRRAILQRLAQGEATVNQLAAPFNMRLPSISKHLKVLREAGLVVQSRKAQWRPCRLEPARLQEVADWAEPFRANWEQQFTQLVDRAGLRPLVSKRMGLRVVRQQFLSRSVAALLAVFVCGGALGWGHVGGDDRDCDPVLVHHDHAAHRFSTAPANQSSSTGDHCYICHSLRLLHHATASRYARVAVDLHTTLRHDADGLTLRDILCVGTGSRAPPSSRL